MKPIQSKDQEQLAAELALYWQLGDALALIKLLHSIPTPLHESTLSMANIDIETIHLQAIGEVSAA